MSDESIVISVRGDVSGGRVIKATLDDIANSGDKATNTTATLEKEMRGLGSVANSLKSAFGGLAAAFGVREIVNMSDNFTLLRERVKLSTQSTQEFTQAFRGLQQVSNETGARLNDAVDVFQRLSFVRTELKATVDEMLTFTGTVQKLGVISGASTTAMSAGLLQLGQSLSAGIVRAEEFNSVVENMPALAKAVADQFGVTTGQLRNLVLDGVVASEDFFNAILNDAARVEEAYATMPMTIGRSFAALRNEFEAFIGQTSDASGAATAAIAIVDGLRLAVFGLGKGFEATALWIGTASASVIESIEMLINRVINRINTFTGFVSKLPGVDIGTIGNVDFNGTDMQGILSEARSQAGGILNSKGPKTIYDDVLGIEDTRTARTEVKALTQDYKALAAQLKASDSDKKAAKAAATEQKRIERELAGVIRESRTETERLYDKMAELEALRPFATTSEQITAINTGIANANKELDELAAKAELDGPVGKAFQSLASEIDDGFKDAFKSAFTETDGGFKKLIQGWVATFKNFLAEMAYQALARPIVLSVVGSIGGSMGLSSNAVASVLGSGGSSGGMFGGGGFNIGSLASAGSSINTLLNGAGNGLINSIGGSLGFYNAVPAAGVMGPVAPGMFGATTLGGALAGGSLGSLGANLLGLGNKNPFINAASGIAGGAAAAGIGALIGAPLGPIGIGVGSFLGTALGGLFGGKKPSDKAQWGGINLDTLDRFGVAGQSGSKFSQQNATYRDSILTEAANLATILKDAGATLQGQLFVHVGNRDGLRLGTSYKTGYQNFGNNSAAFMEAINRRIVESATGLAETFQTILDNVGYSDTKKLAEAFEFGKFFESVINPVDAVAEAIKAANEQFDAMIDRASDLGLQSEKFTTEMEKQRQATIDNIKAQQAGYASLQQLTAAYDSFLKGQALGPNSSLSPMGKLGVAQEAYGSLYDKAKGGDLSVTQELLAAADTLLSVGRSVYASSVSFAGLEQMVRSQLKEIAKASGVPGYATGTDSAQSGLAWVGEQGPELVRFRGGEQVYTASQSTDIARSGARDNAQIISILSDIAATSRSQDERLMRLEKQAQRQASRQKVAQ